MAKKLNKKIRVGIFVDGDFIPSYDGATNRFHYLSRYLQKDGVNVTVFHGYRRWSDLELIKQEPFKTYIFPIEEYYGNVNLIASLIKKEKIQIIQFDNLEPTILQGITLSELTDSYLVSEMCYVVRSLAKSLHASQSKIEEISRLESIIRRNIDHLICLSKDDKPSLIKYTGIPENRISVVPSGVSTEEIKFCGPNFKEKRIVFLGNLFFEPNAEAIKNIHQYIYPKLKRSKFKFLIVGDCPKEMKKKYEDNDFRFIGTIKNLNKAFKKSTFALAPILEGTGLRVKILNYLAAGIPTIATKAAVAGFPNKENFIIEDDFRKYPKIILELMNNKNYSLKIAKNGRAMIEREFDWRIIAKRVKDVYQKILNRPLKGKDKSLIESSPFKISEPAWLEEARKKGRFLELYPPLKSYCFYLVINDSKLKDIRK